jgi:ABC-type nitrate/sulfonate/bicarbonate transport system permease component
MEPIATPLPALSGDFGKRLIRRCLKALPGLTANLASLAIFILVWKFSSDYLHNPLFPGPVIVAKTFLVLLRSGDLQGTTLLHHSYVSLYRVLLGFAAACVTAIPLGILLGLWKPLYTGTRAVSEPLRFTPPLAWIPFAIIFFGGLSRYIFLIWVGTFFPLFIMTMNIIGATPPYSWMSARRRGDRGHLSYGAL